ncbi:MAG: hypothetical protein KC414_13020 [Romboutsia sp.]|nr:hypothetical protein [Romboutsia sp.]
MKILYITNTDNKLIKVKVDSFIPIIEYNPEFLRLYTEEEIDSHYMKSLNCDDYSDYDKNFIRFIIKMHMADKIIVTRSKTYLSTIIALLSFVKEFKDKSNIYFEYEYGHEIMSISVYCELVVNFHVFCQDFPELLYISEHLSDHNM